MESPNDTKQLGEKSAFEDDVNMAEVSNTNESAKTLSNFLVSRSFSQESGLINPATLLNHKVQLSLVSVFVKILELYASVGHRDERTPTDKWARSAVNLLRKEIYKILTHGVHEHSTKCFFLKLHPLAYIKLMRSSFTDIYNQDQ